VYSPSAGQCPNIAVPIGGEFELNLPTRSAHQQGNRGGGHKPPEEAESDNGGKFIETPTPTPQPPQKIPRLLFPVTVVGPWVKGEDSQEWGGQKSLQFHSFSWQSY